MSINIFKDNSFDKVGLLFLQLVLKNGRLYVVVKRIRNRIIRWYIMKVGSNSGNHASFESLCPENDEWQPGEAKTNSLATFSDELLHVTGKSWYTWALCGDWTYQIRWKIGSDDEKWSKNACCQHALMIKYIYIYIYIYIYSFFV